MSPSTENRFERPAEALAAEETLRLIAKLPAPQGLEDRVKERLQSAPNRASVIAWPLKVGGGWMRAAAAAAIVMAVAGGGWGVYSHIQVAPVPSAVVDSQPLTGSGRFSTAGAMHVPQTVEGPVVAAPVIDKQKPAVRTSKGKAKAHKGGGPSAAESKPIE